MRIRRDVVQLRLHVGSEKDHTKPYLVVLNPTPEMGWDSFVLLPYYIYSPQTLINMET